MKHFRKQITSDPGLSPDFPKKRSLSRVLRAPLPYRLGSFHSPARHRRSGESQIMDYLPYLLALAIGVIAGLRALTPPAAICWAAAV